FIRSLALVGNTLYMGGDLFGLVAPPNTNAALFDAGTGALKRPVLAVRGNVYAVAPDGAGGWDLGGAFAFLQGGTGRDLAHVLADGSLAAWDPGANDTVRALAVVGTSVIVGGQFTACAGQARSGLAAVDVSSGGLLPWNPGPDGAVRALAFHGSTLYVGGDFPPIPGLPREGFAGFGLSIGTAQAVHPE